MQARIYHIYFHPDNKHTLLELQSMTIADILDFQEMLEAQTMIKQAAHDDAEWEAKINSK